MDLNKKGIRYHFRSRTSKSFSTVQYMYVDTIHNTVQIDKRVRTSKLEAEELPGASLRDDDHLRAHVAVHHVGVVVQVVKGLDELETKK